VFRISEPDDNYGDGATPYRYFDCQRLTGERSWSDVAGILTEDEADGVEVAFAEGRIRSRRRESGS